MNLLHELRKPHLTILFGSRARGDYAEGHSDVDIMLVEDQRPDEETLNHAALAFRKAKAELYRGQCIDSQWVIRTPEEFERRSRSVNAVDAKALRDGYILGDEREHYSTLARVRSTHHQTRWANSHLSFLNNLKGTDQEQQGTQAYLAITNALTAAGNAAGEWCPDLHDVEMLLELARKADPEGNYITSLEPEIYTQYGENRKDIPPEVSFTALPEHHDQAAQDIQTVLARTEQLKEIWPRRPKRVSKKVKPCMCKGRR